MARSTLSTAGEFHDRLWEALSGTTPEERRVPSRTGGFRAYPRRTLEGIQETLRERFQGLSGSSSGKSQPYGGCGLRVARTFRDKEPLGWCSLCWLCWFSVRDKKETQTQTLCSGYIFRWGGGLPRQGVGGGQKFGMPLETREIKLFGRDIPGFCRDIPEVPEKFEKEKVCVQFSFPIFGFRVLLMPGTRASSRSFRVCPWTSICFKAPSSKFLDLLPPAPLPAAQEREAQHKFLQHKGAHTEPLHTKGLPN